MCLYVLLSQSAHLDDSLMLALNCQVFFKMVSILKQLLHFFPPHFLTLQPYSKIESIIFSLNILYTTPHDNVIFFVLHFLQMEQKK